MWNRGDLRASRGDPALPTSLPTYGSVMGLRWRPTGGSYGPLRCVSVLRIVLWDVLEGECICGTLQGVLTGAPLQGIMTRSNRAPTPSSSEARTIPSVQPSSQSELFRGSEYYLGPTETPHRGCPRLGSAELQTELGSSSVRAPERPRSEARRCRTNPRSCLSDRGSVRARRLVEYLLEVLLDCLDR